MPRSKRAKLVPETRTAKKSHKEQVRHLYANIRECVDKYDYLFVFGVDNMRNTYLKDVRTEFADSRIFFGKTKVMAIALGHTPETEAAQNLHHLAPFVTGDVGLLFTSRAPETVLHYFDTYRPVDFARAGTVSSRSFTIPNGVVYSRGGELPQSEDEPISHTVEPGLRRLGVPTRLVGGKVTLELTDGESGYPVCREGEVLDSRQTTLLKTFGVAMAEFHVVVRAYWSRGNGEVKVLEKKEGEMEVDAQ